MTNDYVFVSRVSVQVIWFGELRIAREHFIYLTAGLVPGPPIVAIIAHLLLPFSLFVIH